MRKLYERIHSVLGNLNMQPKLVGAYMLTVLIPITLINIFFFIQLRENMINYTNIININANQQLQQNVEDRLQDYIRLMDNILTDEVLIEYLNYSYPTDFSDQLYLERVKTFNELYKFYTTRLIASFEGINIKFISTNQSLVFDGKLFYQWDKELKARDPWMEKIMERKREITVLGPFLNDKKVQTIYLGRVLDSGLYEQYSHVVLIEVPISKIKKIIDTDNVNKFVFLTDENDRVVASSSFPELTGVQAEYVFRELIVRQAEGVEVNWRGKEYFAYTEQTVGPINPWRVITLIPSGLVLGKLYSNIQLVVVITASSLLVSAIVMILFAHGLTRRLKILVRGISAISHHDHFGKYIPFSQRDEIGELSIQFKKMMNRIESLIQEVYISDQQIQRVKLEKKAAELKALQSQINPHFLFNTMESIRMNLYKKGDRDTAGVVGSFALLFRNAVYWSNEEITVKHELDMISHYLFIQKFRYRDKVNFILDVENDVESVVIPKFTLQPLVENAIQHGLESKEGKGMVQVFNVCKEGLLLLYIYDNGVGMPQSVLESLKQSLESDDLNHSDSSIGIINVHQRLQRYYGNQYGIRDIKSEPGSGTLIRIELPMKGARSDVSGYAGG